MILNAPAVCPVMVCNEQVDLVGISVGKAACILSYEHAESLDHNL